jgi:hypothetical protein
MPANVGFSSFDDTVAAGTDPTAGGAVAIELPPDLQQHGVLWPNPSDHVSDHSAEGAPWVAAAGTINQPMNPPQGPLWSAVHDGPSLPAVRRENQAAPATRVHDGRQAPQVYPAGKPNIGRPFTAKVLRFVRHLATDQWDPTGKRISPVDAPSAEVDIYGSEHYTRPRMTGYELPALFDWAWASGDQFSSNPGYYGVNASPPNSAPRPQGSVAAQPPSDPYVAQEPVAVASSGDPYDWGY